MKLAGTDTARPEGRTQLRNVGAKENWAALLNAVDFFEAEKILAGQC